MNELSLFTGAGGGLLGSKLLGWKSVGYVEKNDYCQKVLAQRIKDGIFDDAPIFGDIRAFLDQGYAASYQGMVDVVTAGFPCQPFSVAGKRAGEDDARNMWPETIRVIREVRPRFAFLENVRGLLSSGYFGRVLGDLAEAGYDARWIVLGADDVGANHHRKRLWILAYSKQNGRHEVEVQPKTDIKSKRESLKKRGSIGIIHCPDSGGKLWCFPNSDTDRSFDDVANWVYRLEAIGNGQVPAVVQAAWEILN